MKIWHVTRTLRGGSGVYALRLCKALGVFDGIKSTLLTAHDEPAEGGMVLKSVEGKIRKMGSRVMRGMTSRISLSPFHTVRGVERYYFEDRIESSDIVHLHGPLNWIGIKGLRDLIPRGATVFQTVHGSFELSAGCVTLAGATCQRFKSNCQDCPALKQGWKWFAPLELEERKRMISEFELRPIANSEWTRQQILDSALFKGFDSAPVVPPIIADAFFGIPSSTFRDELEIPADNFVITLGARSLTDPYKGIAEFLERYSERCSSNQVTILLIGDGTISQNLELDIRTFGWVGDPTRIAAIYGASDIYVSPTRMESFGMTLAEAQAVGLPVVAFDVGGVSCAVNRELHKYLAPANDWETLFKKLEILQNLSKSERDEISKKVKRWARKSFHANAVANKQMKYYQARGLLG